MIDEQLLELKATIEGIMEEWAAEFISGRAAFLRKRKIQATGELINSLQSEVNKSAAKEVAEILIGFSEHGRLIDMRMNPPAGGEDYVGLIIDWMKRKGLANRFTQRYMEQRRLKNVPEKVLVFIAWGIVKKRTKKYRSKRWWNKAKTGAIADLYNQVAANIPDTISQQIKKQFEDGNR